MGNSVFRSTYFESFVPERLCQLRSTNTTFNLNQSAVHIDVPFNSIIDRMDEGYTLSGSGVQVGFSDWVDASVTVNYNNSVTARSTPDIRFAVNGILREPKAVSYSRDAGGHDFGTCTFSDGFNVQAGDIITVQTEDASGNNCIFNGPASTFKLRRLPSLVRQARSKKQVIWIWAEDTGTLTNNNFQYSYGNGAVGGLPNRGLPALRNGKITRMGITVQGGTLAAQVGIALNGVIQPGFVVDLPANTNKNVITFTTPLNVVSTDIINFVTIVGGGRNLALVNAEIEADE